MIGDAAGIGGIADPITVVLQSAIDVIRIAHIHTDVVELADRQTVNLKPGLARIA